MGKAKHWLWIAALMLALAAPMAWAEEPGTVAGWFEEIVAQIVAAVTGTPTPAETAVGDSGSGEQAEIGIHIPVGG